MSHKAVLDALISQTYWVFAGVKDAFRWDRVRNVITSDREVRAHMIKSLILNTLGLFSIFIFDLILMPLLHRKASPRSIVSTSSIYQTLWVLPVMGGSLYFNGIWSSAIAEKIYTIEHGRQHAVTPARTAASSASRLIFIAASMLLSYALSYIPLIGGTLSFCLICWIDSYYCFEFVWQAKGLSLNERVKYLENRWAYFLGFGVPITSVALWGTPLVNTAIFALLFPAYIVLAIYAKPEPVRPYSAPHLNNHSAESSPPSYIPARLPIFSVVLWVHTHLMRAFTILTGRDRGRRARQEKQWDSDEDVLESGLPLKSPGPQTGVPTLRMTRPRSQFDES